MAVFLATTVGFYFERDAAKKFNLLTALSEEQPVKVRRNGKVMEIPRHDVVVGDVVFVEVGDEVPADGELIVCNDLQINESTLTGEPVAEKSLEGGGDGAYPRNVILRSHKWRHRWIQIFRLRRFGQEHKGREGFCWNC